MIKGSARRHGIADSDIRHAVANAIRVWPMDGFDMIVGPARDGSLIEVGINRDSDIFHAMTARRKFL
ncbi:hypothetical protein [Nakamurella aerolata]|uniref:hypothetical protein n=1 Tax=Nakamurella aerolata TaxID=1656892 RepID=UPI001BB2340B|nr:hypothetical protein [Nakamurella aerolata]